MFHRKQNDKFEKDFNEFFQIKDEDKNNTTYVPKPEKTNLPSAKLYPKVSLYYRQKPRSTVNNDHYNNYSNYKLGKNFNYNDRFNPNYNKEIDSVTEYCKELKKLGSFTNVHDFFSMYVHTADPESLEKDTSYYLFNSDFFPSWERNPEGGMLSLNVSKEKTNEIWEFLVFNFILNFKNFDHTLNFIGISVKPKYKYSEFQFWLNTCNNYYCNLLSIKIRKMLNIPDKYELHSKKF